MIPFRLFKTLLDVPMVRDLDGRASLVHIDENIGAGQCEAYLSWFVNEGVY